jgi:hypothetical protein
MSEPIPKNKAARANNFFFNLITPFIKTIYKGMINGLAEK